MSLIYEVTVCFEPDEAAEQMAKQPSTYIAMFLNYLAREMPRRYGNGPHYETLLMNIRGELNSGALDMLGRLYLKPEERP